jgi:hypothetical protein
MAVLDEAGRKAGIERALAAANARPDAERIRVAWKSSDVAATVVELPVSDVVLNPNSHRIRAQLESSADRELVLHDPFSPLAQTAIEGLLRDAAEFDGLKASLKDVGQAEPGVVTATGLLVNANTRCVALRDIQARYIRVAVLPSDATQEEIDRLELRLQMKRDFRSDYTFTNELLFIEDLIKKYSYQPEQIALEMGWATKGDQGSLRRAAEQVRQYLRVLALVRDVQSMGDGKLKILKFDVARQALMELDTEYEQLKQSDSTAARELRDARLMALLAGAGYRELREIDAEFVGTYLVPAMEDRPTLRPHVDVLTRHGDEPERSPLPGLDVLEDTDASQSPRTGRTAAPILELLIESVDEQTVVIRSSDGRSHSVGRDLFCGELRTAVEGAAEDVRLARATGDQLNRPLDLVRKATKQVRAAIEAYTSVQEHPDFDLNRMRSAVDELASAQQDLLRLFPSEE